MKTPFYCVLVFLASTLSVGCNSGSDSGGGSNGSGGTDATAGGDTTIGSKTDGTWEGYPDVPFVPIMEDVDGIMIPRLPKKSDSVDAGGPIATDVGNKAARDNDKPTPGGQIIIRMNAEPKTLNPITETSSYQTYITQYTHEAMAEMDPETLEYKPSIAEKWVREDSVKLSANYPGKERRIALGDAAPTPELEASIEEDGKLSLTTSDNDGKPVGNTWVHLSAIGEGMEEVPQSGYHHWSDAAGKLTIQGIVAGKYKIIVGAEVFGGTKQAEDGSLVVTPLTPGNPTTEPLTLAADEWVDNQRETYFTYFMRKDVTWSDGQPMTSRDIEFAYAILNNEYVDGESLRIYYQDLIECTAINDHVVRMRYRQQYFKAWEFTYGLAAYTPAFHQFQAFFKADGKSLTLEKLTPAKEIAQKKVSAHGQVFAKFFNTDDRYNLKPMGTGPYIVNDWKRTDRVELTRNPNYWKKDELPYLDKIIFKFIPDSVTAYQALKAGEIDFYWNITPPQFFEDFEQESGGTKSKYVKASWFSPGFGYIGWNALRPQFQDRRVRIALKLLCLDVEEWIKIKLHGEGVQIAGSQYFFGPAYDHTLAPLAHDKTTALDLLAEAGWLDTDNDGVLDKDGKKFEFEFLLPPGNPSAKEQAELIQEKLKAAGITMSVEYLEWASFIDKVKAKDYDVVRLGWSQPLESDPYQIWHSSQAGADKRGSNHVSFADPLADKLIEMIRTTLDEEKRKRIHWSFQRIIDREQPYLFLYTSKDFGVYDTKFRGVKWYRIRPGFDLTEWYIPKELQ
jgi:peptide/nickel transport system substrate-binding protein